MGWTSEETISPRTHFATCNTPDYFYFGAGWEGFHHSGVYTPFDGWFRTHDFLTIERGGTPLLSPPGCFVGAAFAHGRMLVGPRFTGALEVQSVVSESNTMGDGFRTQCHVPADIDTECYFFQTIAGDAVIALGIDHVGNGALTMKRKSFAFNGYEWSIRSSDLGIARRSMADVVLPDDVGLIIGGIDDSAPGGATWYPDIYASTDGMRNVEKILGNAPFGALSGHRADVFGDRLVITAGTDGAASGFPRVNRVWSVPLDEIDNANAWVQHDEPPWTGRAGHGTAVRVIGGVRYLFVFNGMDDLAPNPPPSGRTFADCWRTNNLDDWDFLEDSPLSSV